MYHPKDTKNYNSYNEYLEAREDSGENFGNISLGILISIALVIGLVVAGLAIYKG